jgi:glycerol-3-phosphate dehydrogenase
MYIWQDVAKKSGVELVDNHPVVEIVPTFEQVRVVCRKVGGEKVEFKARGIALCAGPWTNKLTEPLG